MFSLPNKGVGYFSPRVKMVTDAKRWYLWVGKMPGKFPILFLTRM